MKQDICQIYNATCLKVSGNSENYHHNKRTVNAYFRIKQSLNYSIDWLHGSLFAVQLNFENNWRLVRTEAECKMCRKKKWLHVMKRDKSII